MSYFTQLVVAGWWMSFSLSLFRLGVLVVRSQIIPISPSQSSSLTIVRVELLVTIVGPEKSDLANDGGSILSMISSG